MNDNNLNSGFDPNVFMRAALAAAQEAAELGEVPVGAVVVQGGRIVATGFNKRECDRDPTAHAEIIALRQAAKAQNGWRLADADLYVTLEPCPMCAGALVNARIARVFYGCDDPKAGAARSLYTLMEDPRLNHRIEVIPGVMQSECAQILKDFFAGLRMRAAERKRLAQDDPPETPGDK